MLKHALMAFVALVTVLTAGAQALHMTLVAHHLCATHGQVEHAHHGDENAGLSVPTGRDAALGVAADEDHEDCDVPGIAPAIAEAPAPIAISAIAASASQPAAPATVDVVRALWRLAPKTSPPV